MEFEFLMKEIIIVGTTLIGTSSHTSTNFPLPQVLNVKVLFTLPTMFLQIIHFFATSNLIEMFIEIRK